MTKSNPETKISTPIYSDTQPATRPPRPAHENISKLAHRAAVLALEKKATNIQIFDVRRLTSIADFFVLCTGSTDTHVRAITDHIVEKLDEVRIEPWHVEGRQACRWVLIDYIDVVVHIFQPEVRDYYGLERLWGDATIEEVKDEA